QRYDPPLAETPDRLARRQHDGRVSLGDGGREPRPRRHVTTDESSAKGIDPHSDTAQQVSAELADEAYCAQCNKSDPPEVGVCPADGARLVKLRNAADSMIGRTFDGRYSIQSMIGRGGMGTVYRGTQLSVDRPVAIKIVRETLSADRATAKRFL